MKLSFRWYGPSDPVTLRGTSARSRGCGRLSPPSTTCRWAKSGAGEFDRRPQKGDEEAGLSFEVIESIPVHEDIKLGKPTRDRLMKNYCENIRRVAEAGVNVRPATTSCRSLTGPAPSWTNPLPDGSTSLIYDSRQVEKVNPLHTDSDLTLPGWDASYTREELREVVAQYQSVTEEDMWEKPLLFPQKGHPRWRQSAASTWPSTRTTPAGASSACRGYHLRGKPRPVFVDRRRPPTTGSPSAPAASGCSAKKRHPPYGRPNTRRWAGSTFAHLRNVPPDQHRL